MSYEPFRDRKHLIACALQDAIDWELSRQEADVCMGDKNCELLIAKNIKAYRKYLKAISGSNQTSHEKQMQEFDEGIENGEYACLTLEEIKKKNVTKENSDE